MKISDFGKSQNVAKFRLNLVDNINTEVLENHRENMIFQASGAC